MSKLNAERVRAMIVDCLYRDREVTAGDPPPADAVLVDAVTKRFGFHPTRLESHRGEITNMLFELPVLFRENAGGGWSFLNACQTADGEQWGEHHDVEALLALAIGLGLARWCLQRSLWSALPGGMPYVVLALPEVRS